MRDVARAKSVDNLFRVGGLVRAFQEILHQLQTHVREGGHQHSATAARLQWEVYGSGAQPLEEPVHG